MKYILYISGLIILLTSCKETGFLNRRYTGGRFVEHIKPVKHNTFYSDSTRCYTSTDNKEIKSVSVQSHICSEKEMIHATLNSIIKKDSIYIFRKKGRDKKILVKNNLEDETVYLDEHRQVIYKEHRAFQRPAEISPERKKYKREEEINIFSALALGFSILPIIGFALAVRSIKLINKYRKEYAPERKNVSMGMSVSGLAISIIPSLAMAALVLLIVVLLFGLIFLL